jgi:myo-inositol-1(or 4)-monophosphatase
VSVAAVIGEPQPTTWTALAGAVYDGSGTMWSAAAGQGAWRDDAPLRREGGPALEGTLLATGFQYIAERRAAQGGVVAKLLPQVRDIRRLGACSVDLCLVAAGDIDAYFENGLHPWDFAAGALICQEAGVRVAGADGSPAHHGILIAAMPSVWDSLRDAIVAAGGEAPWDTPTA